MRLVALTHVDFEGPGHIAAWAKTRGHQLSTLALHGGDALPTTRDFDGLIVMGGPMGAYDDHQYPWMAPEKELLGRVVAAGLPVLGVCLGAQLLAAVLGATVGKSPQRELGFHPVQLAPHGQDVHLTRDFPASFAAFHWHGDAFEIPRHGVHLFQSQGCPSQGFALGEHVLGLQFHLEMTQTGLEALLTRCADELTPGPYVQTASAMRKDAQTHLPALHKLTEALLDRFLLDD